MHEHIFVLDHELRATFPKAYDYDSESVVANAVEKLDAVGRLGFGTVVDMTVLGIGRDLGLLREVAARTSMNIVVATGAYVLRDLPVALQLRGPGRTMFGGPEPLVELFVRDITEGVERSGVKAGVLKCATDRFGLTKDVERTLRAVAQAHLLTGVPISTHTNASQRVGLDQQRVFAEEGVDLANVVIGHSGDTDDLEYLHELLGAGSYLGMDRFGLDYFLELDRRADVVAALCAEGHADRIVLSHDACCHNIAYGEDEMRKIVPLHGFELLAREVLPALARRGVTDDQINQMLVVNPRAILERSPVAP
jgi:phosphotriesterase-related protein